jgi:hypothetical protein
MKLNACSAPIALRCQPHVQAAAIHDEVTLSFGTLQLVKNTIESLLMRQSHALRLQISRCSDLNAGSKIRWTPARPADPLVHDGGARLTLVDHQSALKAEREKCVPTPNRINSTSFFCGLSRSALPPSARPYWWLGTVLACARAYAGGCDAS